MKRGFTLIEVIMGLFLLGLITVTILPLTNGVIVNLNKQKEKANMIYLGEMVLEKIRASSLETSSELYIYDINVKEIIELFCHKEYIEINLDKGEYEYPIKIIKENKSELLWSLTVLVYNKNGGKLNNVEFKAYLPKK